MFPFWLPVSLFVATPDIAPPTPPPKPPVYAPMPVPRRVKPPLPKQSSEAKARTRKDGCAP